MSLEEEIQSLEKRIKEYDIIIKKEMQELGKFLSKERKSLTDKLENLKMELKERKNNEEFK